MDTKKVREAIDTIEKNQSAIDWLVDHPNATITVDISLVDDGDLPSHQTKNAVAIEINAMVNTDTTETLRGVAESLRLKVAAAREVIRAESSTDG